MSTTTIQPTELFQKFQQGERIHLIDVRTPLEFSEVHATLAENVPLDGLDPVEIAQQLNGSADQPLFVICRSGNRSTQACQKLEAAGIANIVNVVGGTSAWESANLPVVRGKKVVSLERQVRITAGLLVLIGAVLGYFVHPYFIGLAAFVGAGLTFAGITDTCGMGMLLARMPWNRVDPCSKDSCKS